MAEVKTGIEEVRGVTAWSAQIWVGLRVTDHAYEYTTIDVEDSCQEFVDEESWCVTVTPTTYVYTNGGEPGAVVGCIAYPRYETAPDVLRDRTIRLAKKLLIDLKQTFVTIVIRGNQYEHENIMIADWDRYNLNERNRNA